jgi:uncharacterized cupredoxin-like copper-binding protein
MWRHPLTPPRTVLAALALGGALALAAVVSAQPQPTVINVELSEYKCTPMDINLNKGQAYLLHLANTGGKTHDLSAKAFFQTVSLSPATASKVHHGDVELDRGESADLVLTPQASGTYEMHCTEPFHSMLGMKGHIIVH